MGGPSSESGNSSSSFGSGIESDASSRNGGNCCVHLTSRAGSSAYA
ncbi:hypothetical protein HaLaN_13781 [Haematococcus lacustris]|uniref:Uncharacterized protein n=1 Tax=Haematococcus lacustris TaxID=44745 RepID=A0A699Z535_HAELA|nr:hypothetical protein HaLaN_13781 [Haematococcus lacustris]